MKINLLSDLHLEFCPMPPIPSGETLFLAGDILVSAYLNKKRTDRGSILRRRYSYDFLTECSNKYERVYYIAGNHESYHGNIQATHQILGEFIREFDNVQYLNNDVTPLTYKTMLFGATMWTNMNKGDPNAMWNAKRAMCDFDLIMNGPDLKWTPEDTVVENAATLNCLSVALQQYPDKDFVVMTHHTPSFLSIHDKYKTSYPLNYAFSSDLSEFILDHPRIKTWVHGHTHDTFNYTLGSCRIMCNPRGYTNNPNVVPENKFWDINFNFEVE